MANGRIVREVVGHPTSSPPQQGSAEKWPLSLAELLWRRKALTAVLIISLAARIALVLKGGQFFYPDEERYLRCFTFLHELRLIDLSGIAHQIYGTSAHLGFMFTGLPAAILHIAFLAMRGLPATQSSVIATAWVSGLCFAIPSVISIALVYAISRRAAATSAEALLAAFLMACSNALFYYCRHFLPYDLSMALTLLALWLGLAERPTALTSVRCGFIAGLGMLTYNGYWAFSAMVLGIHVLHRVPNVGAAVKRTVLAFLAAISVPAGLTVVSVLLGKPSYLSLMRRFANTITQGDYHEGAVLPLLYLWDTEHAVAVAWAGAALLALWYCRKDGWRKRPFILFCLAAVVATYGLLALGSIVLSKFVVYGRLVRQLIPWLCLASAHGLARAVDEGPRYRMGLAAACAALALQAAYNMSGPLRQRFPAELRRTVYARYGGVDYDVSFNGVWSWEYLYDVHVRRAILPDGSDSGQAKASSAFVLVNAQFLYPLRSWRAPITGELLFSIPHPLAYRPYQYEGLRPRERNLLLQGDYSMRLLRRASQSGNPPPSSDRP